MKRTVMIVLALVFASTMVSAQEIYLTATQSNEIYVANRDGSGTPTLLHSNAASGSAGPVGLIAVLGGVDQLFYGGGNNPEIDVASVDGSGTPSVLWADAGDEHLGITADPANGILYWTTESGEAIRSGAWDGSGGITDVFSGLTDEGPVGITFDDTTDTLYWTSVQEDLIVTGSADGTTGPTVLYNNSDGVAGPRQIVFSGGTLYWTEHDGSGSVTGRIVSAPASGAGSPTTLFNTDNPYLPYGIDIDGNTLLWTELVYQGSGSRVVTGAADGSGSMSVLFAGDFGSLRGIAAGVNIIGGGGPPPDQAIPTLSRWGLSMLVVLLATGAIVVLRRTGLN